MVMYLTKPVTNEEDLIDQLVEERKAGRHRTYFTDIHRQWRQRVTDYVAAQGNPEIVKPWDDAKAVGDRFRNLYKSPADNSVQKPILEALRVRELQLCPACGEDGTPNTLDHYLPKAEYPEFSVTPSNLFPMCDICQGWKDESTVSEEGFRLFLHPYFDGFLQRQVVKLTIGGPFNAPASFKLSVAEDLDEAYRGIIDRHLMALNIHTRYGHFFKNKYIHLLRLAQKARDSQWEVRASVEGFRFLASMNSTNSWGHVFYDGVLGNDALMGYLSLGALPQV